MADEPCAHCREQHPSTTAFCPNTGKPIHRAPRPTGQSAVPESAPSVASGSSRGSGGLPSWVSNPEGPPSGASGTSDGGPKAGPNLEGGDEKGVLDLLSQAFQLYKKHAKLLITVAAVVFVPGALAHACAHAAILAPAAVVSITLDPVTHLPTAPLAVGSMVAGFTGVLLGLLAAAVTGLFLHGIIVPLVEGALAIAAADRLAGGNADWRTIWTWLFRRVGTVLSAVIPAALLTGAGFFFLVVPGLLLAFFFSFVPLVALFEGIGGTAALRRSFVLVRSDWLRMLLVLIAFAVISFLAQMVAGMFGGGLFGTRLLQDLLMLAAMPIPVLGAVLLYFDVRRKHDPEGFGNEQLAREMESLRGGD